MWIASGSGLQCPFVFGIRGSENTDATKDNVAAYLTNHVLRNRQFTKAMEGPLGTHSLRKFAATHAQSCGCSPDEAEVRGQWKQSMKIVDKYTDPRLPATDAKVAAVLCRGGPCKYVLKRGCGISEDWILEYAVPKIALRFP